MTSTPEKKTIDGWLLFQGVLMTIMTLVASYVANQITSLNHSVNDLNKTMSAIAVDVSNQKSVMTQHYGLIKDIESRLRDLEIKSGPIRKRSVDPEN